ncbi:MAG: metallophosphoesterase family protein [Candidatus Heimdallarchaeota archaeon]
MSVKIFVAGDLHIPSRSTMLHPNFQGIIESEVWDYIVLTGDLTIHEVIKWFKKYLAKKGKVVACRGNMDQFNLPLKPRFEINGVSFGVFHGTDISPRGDIKQLKKVAEDMKVQVLFTGHSHQSIIHHDKEHLIINPGTGTGASGGSSWSVDTACVVLEINPESKEVLLNWYRITDSGKLTVKSNTIQL